MQAQYIACKPLDDSKLLPCAPATKAPISSDMTRVSFSTEGTSPLTMRCARPSAMAVLPTPAEL